MPGPKFKQKCAICKVNMVLMYSYRQFPICVKCQMQRIDKEIKDPQMKKMFAISKELYEQSSFLRNIKESYLRFDSLTEKQIEAFKKTIKDLGSKASESSDTQSSEPKPKAETKSKKASKDGKKE